VHQRFRDRMYTWWHGKQQHQEAKAEQGLVCPCHCFSTMLS
jgi:hypothetical protein